MAALASSALGAAVLFEVVLRSTEGSTGVIVTNLAYPLGDILLISAVIGVFSLTGWKPDRTWGLIGAGLAATAVADGIVLFQTATDSYAEGSILDALWPGSMLLLSAAAWQVPSRATVELEGRPLLATPLVCGLIGLGIFAYDHFRPVNVVAASLAGATIIAVIVRTGMTFRQNTRILGLMRDHAVTDTLTGLGNRRRLVADLEVGLADGAESEPRLLAIFDLDGFKLYNDTFGHRAGDALLARLAVHLAAVVQPAGSCYRLGGDEFCVLSDVSRSEAERLLASAATALRWRRGIPRDELVRAVSIPEEAAGSSDALRLADQRMYAQKRTRGRRSIHEVLLQALYEREPGLRLHVQSVAEAAAAVGAKLGLAGDAFEELRLAARLHDVGKLAIPDTVLQKPGPLDVEEWAFIKEHTVIGERILAAAPPWGGSRRSSGPRTSAGTAWAIPTGLPRRDPAGRADHRGLRCVLGDDLAASVPNPGHPRRGARGAPALRRHPVRPRGRGRVLPRGRPRILGVGRRGGSVDQAGSRVWAASHASTSRGERSRTTFRPSNVGGHSHLRLMCAWIVKGKRAFQPRNALRQFSRFPFQSSTWSRILVRWRRQSRRSDVRSGRSSQTIVSAWSISQVPSLPM